MAINHGVIKDTDPHFIIDPVSRKLSTESTKITLVQGDHKSERFTFELPQTVEGHNMQLTDKVQIHYINIDQLTKAQSEGLWEADDVAIVPATDENPAKVTFSWLIEDKATKYQGVLNFVVRFVCYDGSIVTYSWSTAIHTGIQVASGINVGSMVVEEYIDILRKWENDLKANQVVKMEQTQTGDADGGENIWTVTFGDGRTSELKVKNGSKGDTGDVGSIETVTGEILQFYIGSQEYFEKQLTDEQKLNCFAIFTDDTTAADLFAAIEELQTELREHTESILPVNRGGTGADCRDAEPTKDSTHTVLSGDVWNGLQRPARYLNSIRVTLDGYRMTGVAGVTATVTLFITLSSGKKNILNPTAKEWWQQFMDNKGQICCFGIISDAPIVPASNCCFNNIVTYFYCDGKQDNGNYKCYVSRLGSGDELEEFIVKDWGVLGKDTEMWHTTYDGASE